MTALGSQAFYDATLPAEFVLPETVTEIGIYAFAEVDLPAGFEIPPLVTEIADGTFSQATFPSSFSIPDSITTIGYNAFFRTNIALAALPSSLTSIGDSAFSECLQLTGALVIPATVTSIGERVFESSDGITGLTLSDGVAGLEDWAFSGMTGLETLHIEGDLDIPAYGFMNCSALTTLDISAGAEVSFGIRAFSGIAATSLDFSGVNVSSVGSKAFYSAPNLVSIDFGDSNGGVSMTVENQDFVSSSSLASITFPAELSSIGNTIFANTSDPDLVFYSATPPSTTVADLFTDFPAGGTIYVPNDSLASYQAASRWDDYVDNYDGFDPATDPLVP
ncbi:MAG: leucine-rich repeat domain-containing protein [Spirochaetales bacterium]|nr:leucine-rich repeat domain-containing protein [Spirochaetales bacterium]